MAETVKKVKAPSKPRKLATRKDNDLEVRKKTPSNEEIAQLAQKFWAERGYQDGHAEQDWLRAERELQKT